MKILSINRDLNQPLSTTVHNVTIIPDSAMIQGGKPFFIPNFSQNWEYQASIAFRIKRLGKKIGKKFASRYYDAIALAVNTIPVDTIIEGQSSSAIFNAFDGAFIIGDWIELDQLDNTNSLSVSIGNETISVDINQLAIDDTIATISQYITLKIGDIITPAHLPISGIITIDTIVNGTLNNTPNLRLKFK